MLATDTVLQSRYRIIRQLGAGGMGTVYKATDQRLNTTVALKETHFTDERLLKQFEREAQLLARLHHPALPVVIDHFSEGGGQFLVMQFIVGEDLGKMLEHRGSAFPVDEVLNWADQLLDALEYLHSQEPPIIHRDIKPQNLKLAARGQIILLDFGLAKGFAGQTSRLTASGSIFGFTPNYAPLEQIQGMGTDPRSDLYSLSATLYHLATITVPPDVLTRVTATSDGHPDPLRPAHEMNPEVSADIAVVLQRGMAIGRTQRPADAATLRKEFRDAGQTIRLTNSREMETDALPPTLINLSSTIGDFSQQEVSQKQENAPSPTVAADMAGQDDLSETQKLQLEYWTAFREFLLKQHSSLTPTKPLPQYWFNFYPFGRSGFRLSAYAGMRDRWIGVELVLHGPEAKPHFYLLAQEKEHIEQEIGTALEWRERPTGKESYITLRWYAANPNDRKDWPYQHQWLHERLEAFYQAFAFRIKGLNASDYPPTNYDEEAKAPQESSSNVAINASASPAALAPEVISESTPSMTPAHPLVPRTPSVIKSNRLPLIMGGVVALLVIGIIIALITSQRLNISSDGNSSVTPTMTPEIVEKRFARERDQVDFDPTKWLSVDMKNRMLSQGVRAPLDSDDPEFLYLYGRASLLTGSYLEAVAAFKKTIEKIRARPTRDPFKIEAKISVVAAALKTANWVTTQTAAKEFDEVIESGSNWAPSSSDASLPTSVVPEAEFEELRLEVDRAPNAMLMRLSRASKGNPLESYDPRFLYLYGRALLLSGKPVDALPALNRAAEQANAQQATMPLRVEVGVTTTTAAVMTGNWAVSQAAAKKLDEIITSNKGAK